MGGGPNLCECLGWASGWKDRGGLQGGLGVSPASEELAQFCARRRLYCLRMFSSVQTLVCPAWRAKADSAFLAQVLLGCSRVGSREGPKKLHTRRLLMVRTQDGLNMHA